MEVFNFTKKMNVKTFFVTLAFVGLSIGAVMAQSTYSIKRVSSQFLIYKNGSVFSYTLSIQGAIDDIRDDVNTAGSVPCIIQFGEGNVLDLGSVGTKLIIFENTGTKKWGKITLTGKATTASTDPGGYGIIVVENEVSVDCQADINATAEDVNFLIRNKGTLTISDGTILVNNCVAIRNTKTLTISGGKILSKTQAIGNYAGGTINISGGTISTNNANDFAYTIINGDGYATISGGTIENTHNFGKTIGNIGQLAISGGTVKSKGGNAVTNSGGTIDIKEYGRVFSQEGYAVDNSVGGGTVTIKNNSIVFAYGAIDTDIIQGNYTRSNNAVIAAWNNAVGTAAYTVGTSKDIYKLPDVATAVWAKQGSEDGISVKYGATEGFIPIESVTVGTTGISEITNNNLQIFPSPTSDILYFSVETPYEIIDLQGKLLLKSEKAVNSVNISSLPSGTYFVTLHTETGKVVRKVIKE